MRATPRAPGLAVGGLVLVLASGGWPGALHSQEPLEAVVERVTEQWVNAGPESLLDLLHPEGVRLVVPGEEGGTLSPRRVVAGLESHRTGLDSRGARIKTVQNVGGVPAQGFAEIIWSAAPSGTSEVLEEVLFLGFVRQDDAWWIREIRIMPAVGPGVG